MDTWAQIREHRTRLIDELESFSDEQWESPTLCEGWRVKDIVGHLAATAYLRKGRLVVDVVKAGFRVNKAIDDEARRWGATPRADLVKRYREGVESRALPPGLKPVALLTDVVMHSQDVHRPLGLPSTFDAAVTPVILEFVKDQRFLGATKRRAGLRLVATDLDWSVGDGPEVKGTGEALFMVLGGRPAALDDLEGEGVATLRERMKA